MSGRIWVIEHRGDRRNGRWHVLVTSSVSRDNARSIQMALRHDFPITRVVQYVRQGGAR